MSIPGRGRKRKRDEMEASDFLLSSVPLLAFHHFSNDRNSHKRFMGVFLCLDTQGFTEFVHSRQHQPVQLSNEVNNLFQKIIEKIVKYNGDIIKFTGDGFQVVWRYYANPTNSSVDEDAAIGLAMLNALNCAIDITKEKYLDKIIIRAGLSMGEILGMITHYQYGLGYSKSRREVSAEQKVRKEYFVFGETVEEGNNCEKAYKNMCEEQGPCTGVVTTMAFNTKFQSLYPDITMSGETFRSNDGKEYFFCSNITPIVERRYVKPLEQDKRDRCTPSLEKYLKPFTHELVRVNESNQHTPSFSICMFICLHMNEIPANSVTTSTYNKDGFIARSNAQYRKDKNLHLSFTICFNCINKSLRENHGMLRQFILDDKGIVAICTFDSDNQEIAERNAAKASQHIQHTMHRSSTSPDGAMHARGISISTSIGMSLGNPQSMWFGLLGSRSMRQEYMVLGCPVLIAARLMALDGPANQIRCHNFSKSLQTYFSGAFSHESDQEATLKVFGKIRYQLFQLKA